MTEALFAKPRIQTERHANGVVLVRSEAPLHAAPPLVDSFRAHAAEHPDRVLVTDRMGGPWRTCTWGQMRTRVDAIAQGLIDRRLTDRPIAILSGASIDHLALLLAALTIGVAVVPTSVAYSLRSATFDKLKGILDLVNPGVVFAQDASFASAVKAAAAGRDCVVLSPGGVIEGSTDLDALVKPAGPEVERRHAAVQPDTLAKIMFTSGSTDKSKGVINTHAMLAVNQQQILEVWPFLAHEPPVLLDWLPWSHTFGGNHNVNMALAHGGSIWIDNGGPTPDLILHTVENLKDVQPTIFFNVPLGYASLIPLLEKDDASARLFFKNLRIGFFAAAALPQALWDRITRLAQKHRSSMVMTTSWGLTETSPGATTTHFLIERSDNIGVPLPGVELKLVPKNERLELCIRGPNVTPGYYEDPETTAAKFDSEGFLNTGDAVRLLDENDASCGMVFDGRIAENFKLMSGTFVNAGILRPELLSAAGGLLADAVICGVNTEAVTALVWLTAEHGKRCDATGMPDEPLRAELANALKALAGQNSSSSHRIERLLILTAPPQLESGELTDKGYINQARVRALRPEAVAALRRDSGDSRVVWREARA